MANVTVIKLTGENHVDVDARCHGLFPMETFATGLKATSSRHHPTFVIKQETTTGWHDVKLICIVDLSPGVPTLRVLVRR